MASALTVNVDWIPEVLGFSSLKGRKLTFHLLFLTQLGS